MTRDEQLQRWVDGGSWHNPTYDECCPDFSCCRPDLQQPVEARRAFQAANEDQRHEMLLRYAVASLADQGREPLSWWGVAHE